MGDDDEGGDLLDAEELKSLGNSAFATQESRFLYIMALSTRPTCLQDFSRAIALYSSALAAEGSDLHVLYSNR